MSDLPPSSSSKSSSASSAASSSSGGSSSSASSSASSSSASSSSSSSQGLSSGAVAITASFVVVGGVVLIVLAVLIIKYVQKRMLETTSGGDVDPEPLNSIVCVDSKKEGSLVESGDSKNMEESLIEKPKKFTSKELEILTGNYKENLGSGGFGDVYKGGVIHGEPFAVKILRDDLGYRAEVQFIAEVGTLGRTNHVNLVRLCGYCFDGKTKALVYEYMENGSLDRYLKSDNIKWQQLYEIAVGTAKGIQYLHEDCHQQIIHYDIKPANILLNKNWSPKIADFGLAEMFERQTAIDTIKNIMGGKGTPGFAAPEIWIPGLSVTSKCDVYSFGKVMFSMLWSTWNLKFKEQKQDLNELTFESWVRKKVDDNELESVIANCGDEEDREKIRIMCKVALQCVKEDPGERPSMSEVVRKLNPDNKKDELTATAKHKLKNQTPQMKSPIE